MDTYVDTKTRYDWNAFWPGSSTTLLDHILVEHINTLPVSCKFDGSRRKIILYKLLKKLLVIN